VWEPAPFALGIALTTESVALVPGELIVVRADIDLSRLNVV
jgi:hypothetical protein